MLCFGDVEHDEPAGPGAVDDGFGQRSGLLRGGTEEKTETADACGS